MSQRFADLDVFVVDDESFSRSIVTRMLRKVGVTRMRHAADGRDALDTLRCLRRFDCVVLDFHMPGINGLELLKMLRDGSAGVDRHLPVVMLTGHGDLSLVRTAMALDVNAFLTKPTSIDVVADRLLRIRTQDVELKEPREYAAIPLPKGIVLSDGSATADRPRPILLPMRAIRVRLEHVPADAVLVREVSRAGGGKGSVRTGRHRHGATTPRPDGPGAQLRWHRCLRHLRRRTGGAEVPSRRRGGAGVALAGVGLLLQGAGQDPERHAHQYPNRPGVRRGASRPGVANVVQRDNTPNPDQPQTDDVICTSTANGINSTFGTISMQA